MFTISDAKPEHKESTLINISMLFDAAVTV